MPKVTIEPPKDAGAARISVFAPDGRMLVAPRLVLPPTGTFEFDAPKPGTYTANLESLGAGQGLWSFPVEGSQPLTVQAPPLRSMQAARPQAAGAGVRQGIAAVEVAHADGEAETSPGEIRALTAGLGIGRDVFSAIADVRTAAGSAPSLVQAVGAAYSLGVSYDSKPLSYGGWRPFAAGKTVHMHHTDSGDVEIAFDRSDDLPPANSGARLRLSFAIEATRVQRMLVPLFAGGVTVRLRTATAPYLMNDKLSILPTRPETHALLQALTSSSTDVATGIWSEIGEGPAHLARYASADVNDDPWVSVAVGLLKLRLGWLGEHDTWIEGLALQHAWVADASILAAHQRLARTPPDIDGALKALQQARRVGALYFFEANRLQGDLLVALAADAPQEAHRRLAAAELARWRSNLANQVQVGAFFSWLMTKGARTRGGLDQRYSTILDTGRLAVQY